MYSRLLRSCGRRLSASAAWSDPGCRVDAPCVQRAQLSELCLATLQVVDDLIGQPDDNSILVCAQALLEAPPDEFAWNQEAGSGGHRNTCLVSVFRGAGRR
jgi:hypothetical protein